MKCKAACRECTARHFAARHRRRVDWIIPPRAPGSEKQVVDGVRYYSTDRLRPTYELDDAPFFIAAGD